MLVERLAQQYRAAGRGALGQLDVAEHDKLLERELPPPGMPGAACTTGHRASRPSVNAAGTRPPPESCCVVESARGWGMLRQSPSTTRP